MAPFALSADARVDVAFDRRLTSHTSAGMALYVRRLGALLPVVAPELRFAWVGRGDNFGFAEQLGLPFELVRRRPRLAHLPTPFVPLVVPVPFVLTIHDLIDLHYPQFGKRKVGPYYRWAVGPVARRARAVITDDEATVADLVAFLGVDRGRVRVIPLGVDDLTSAAPLAAERPYFLYVGNHRGHKDLATLVRAWAALEPALAVDLIFTGPDDVGAQFAGLGRARGRLRFAGDVGAAELAALYRGACAYVHPALREGFGLPLLEAMRAGVPVIAATGAVPRILAPFAQTFSGGDVGALTALLARALRDPATALAARAQAQTRELTWERTARATADVYREFL